VSDDEDWREDCAPRRILELFSTKWTSMVLHVLHVRLGGSARAGVLLRAVPGISKKMLTQTLRDMEHAGLVHRHVEGTIPPAAEYSMTDLRKRFVEPIEMIYAWARENNDALDALKLRETSRRSM
jgi:DNA-binding HxlR family transcriptional regulator